ncbi:hypothetical protein BH20ACT2_BH20ACT2_04060 [soil metagenome]
MTTVVTRAGQRRALCVALTVCLLASLLALVGLAPDPYVTRVATGPIGGSDATVAPVTPAPPLPESPGPVPGPVVAPPATISADEVVVPPPPLPPGVVPEVDVAPPNGPAPSGAGPMAASSLAGAGQPLAPPPPPLDLGSPAPPAEPSSVWAVIIGIDDYPGVRSDLQAAVNDADDMFIALNRLGTPPEQLRLVRNGEATRDNISASLDWLVANAGPGTTAVFFYAGHVRKLNLRTEAIVAADAALITDGEVADDLAGLQARHTWLVLAACFGGGFTELLAPNRVLTGASGAFELAYENSRFGRSYLGEYLVRRALIGGAAAAPTVQDAFAYAQTALHQDFPDRKLTHFDLTTETVSLRSGAPDAATAPDDPANPAPGTPPSGTGGVPGIGGGPAPGEEAPPPPRPTSPPRECRVLLIFRC